jgi:hypothetical protein
MTWHSTDCAFFQDKACDCRANNDHEPTRPSDEPLTVPAVFRNGQLIGDYHGAHVQLPDGRVGNVASVHSRTK